MKRMADEKQINCGIFTDTFPPNVGGVSTVTSNYAKELYLKGLNPVVAAPWYPDAEDAYPYHVLRYPSIKIGKRIGYRAGNPFNPRLIYRIIQEKLDIIHVHSPFISTILARVVRRYTGIPIILTYHSKFDIDIENRIVTLPIRHASLQFMLHNIEACDEVWTVSEGAGDHLRELGYKGPLRIMRNGTDFQRARATPDELESFNQKYDLSPEETVFLFVGRIMWYKNLKLIVDGLHEAKKRGAQFRMIFVGQGLDFEAVEAYVRAKDMMDVCQFVGLIQDRALLKVFYSRASLFVFPSTYDTNGVVVSEAAACSCPSLLIKGSCAAEGVEDKYTGLLIEEDPIALCEAIEYACSNKEDLRHIGENASNSIYYPWTQAVDCALSRYVEIIAAMDKPKARIKKERYTLIKDSGFKQKNRRNVQK